jgi:hypothetical protein
MAQLLVAGRCVQSGAVRCHRLQVLAHLDGLLLWPAILPLQRAALYHRRMHQLPDR